MMPEQVIPDAVRLAAKRAFVKTTAQAYYATIPAGGLTAAVIMAFAGDGWVAAVISLAAAVASPPLAGLRAYFKWLGGVDEVYVEAAIATNDDVERITSQTRRELRELRGE